MPTPLYSRFFAQAIALVQCGRNNPPVKKGSNAYCKSFLSFCLVTERVEVLPHYWSLSVSKLVTERVEVLPSCTRGSQLWSFRFPKRQKQPPYIDATHLVERISIASEM